MNANLASFPINSPVVVLEFKGNETRDEMYRIVLTSLKDIIRVGMESQQDLRPLQLDLAQYQALVENEMSRRSAIDQDLP